MKYFKHLKGVRDRYWLFKLILIMKLTLIFIVIFNLQSVASVYSQQKVTINLKSADFKTVISAIQKQTNYHFVFSERKIPVTRNVSINVENENVTTVLSKLLANSNFTYTLLENNLIVITTKNEVVNNAIIHGSVLDEKGLPLPGVSVKIKGTTTGTVTDANGGFSINVPDNSVLIFSFIGYENQEISTKGKTTINVNMVPSSKSLNEVVVTALGIKKEERKLGYSVTTVGGDLLDIAKETNVANSLEGRVAGLQISGTNGGPGSSVRIMLRGVTSQGSGSSSPLFVINGVPIDNTQRGSSGEWGGADYGDGISNLNPDDIESMTVLKGQSASALYGTRAANGVILITTKSGKKNSGFGVEFNTNYQLDKAINNLDFQQVYGQGQNGLKPTTVADALNSGNLAWGAKLDGSQVIQFDGKNHTYSAVKNNALSFYNVGNTLTNTLSLTGGNETGAFRLSLSDLNNHSIVPNSGLNRKTFNLNATETVLPKLDVTVSANYIIENSKNRPSLSDGPGNPNNVLFLAPNEDQKILAPGYDASGKETSFTDDVYVTNPYFAANKFVTNVGRNRLISALSAKYDFTKWFYGQIRVGYDNSNNSQLNIEPTGTAYRSDNGSITQQTGVITELNSDVLFGAKHDLIKDWVNLDLSVGANVRKHTETGTNINGGGFIIPYFYSLTNLPSRNSSVYDNRLQTNSAYYTADFAIRNFLVLSTTGRYDTYSTLPSSNRGIFTPSVSGSFIFTDLYHIEGVDFGKIRLSYAQTSGTNNNYYGDAIYYNINNSINGTPAAGFGSTLPNLFLKPFILTEVEAGAEMKLWGDRLGFDVAYFSRKSKNEISQGSIDISSGYTSHYIATGSTQNKGVEIEVHGTPVKTADFSWTPAFNFTYVSNKILKTDATNGNVSLGTYRPLNANLAFVVGLAGPQIMAYDYKRSAGGQIIFDASGLPEQGSLKPMGSTIPKFYGGFNNDFHYKSFNLSFLIDYRYGNKVLSATSYYSIARGENKITLPGRETGVVGTGVTESGTANAVNVSAETYYQALAQRISALNVLDGSFIKLRQITFGYTISKTTLTRTPFSSINISLVGRNLWTIMKRSDNIDPESAFSSNVGYSGIEGTSLPQTRTYGFNVNFKLKN
jgi:TonB-linked SusC/RagA family outer membrane protein